MPIPIYILHYICQLRLCILQHNIQLFPPAILFLYVGILYLSGEPILLHLLRYSAFAVDDHIPCASHLQQPRLVNNPGVLCSK